MFGNLYSLSCIYDLILERSLPIPLVSIPKRETLTQLPTDLSLLSHYPFSSQITFLPIGQVMASSLLVTLMARPSIARELAQDQLGLSLENNIDAASHAAPQSLAKPVVRRLMRNEYKKRPKGDGTGVHMTMTQSQMAVEGDGRRFEMDDDDASQFGEKRSMFSSPSVSGMRGVLQPTPFQPSEFSPPTEKTGRRVNFKEMFLGDGNSGGVASRMKTLVPNTSTDVGTSDSRYLGAVVASTPNVNIARMANIGAGKGEKIVEMPRQESQSNLTDSAAPAGEVEVVQYGRTPLGRLVPMHSSNSLTPPGSHTPYSSENVSDEYEEGTVRPL